MSTREYWRSVAIAVALTAGFFLTLAACVKASPEPEPIWRVGGYNVGKMQDGKVSCYVMTGHSISCVVLP